eukprot:scaffold8710_cov53-Cyclotella_meneghiniana.AAC.2
MEFWGILIPGNIKGKVTVPWPNMKKESCAATAADCRFFHAASSYLCYFAPMFPGTKERGKKSKGIWRKRNYGESLRNISLSTKQDFSLVI